ncbi:MAG TPA: AraC family transcriptional regulator [Myxococcaceae bacterium]|nr:AraC family transcriptional regulator [Myxococcaceae bacterium]
MAEGPDALDDALTELRFRCAPMTFEETARPWRRQFPTTAVTLHVPLEGLFRIDVDEPTWLHPSERGEVLVVNRGVGGALQEVSEPASAPSVFSVRIDFEAPHGHPLLEALPRVIQAAPSGRGPRSFGPLLDALLAELTLPLLGREGLATRLCEGLFIEALRFHLASIEWNETGLLRALADPVVRSGLNAACGEGSETRAIPELARAGGRSHRRFGARFQQFAGSTPSDHVRRTRIRRAARLLREGETDLARVAHVTGYRSRPSFCRAFKEELGITPAAYWRNANGRPFPRQSRGPEKTRWQAEEEYGCPDVWEMRFALEEELERDAAGMCPDCGERPTELE